MRSIGSGRLQTGDRVWMDPDGFAGEGEPHRSGAAGRAGG